jgi:hypothetical protein
MKNAPIIIAIAAANLKNQNLKQIQFLLLYTLPTNNFIYEIF